MFTGIIETIGVVSNIKKDLENIHFTIKSTITNELKIDQSVAHNGVCLTVINIENNVYTVTAIQETLDKTNLNTLNIGDVVNLERAMKLGDRLDGHIVQGHVDQTAVCKTIEEAKQIKDKDIADALQLPPIKLHCSVLAEEAIKKAISDYNPQIGHNNPPKLDN